MHRVVASLAAVALAAALAGCGDGDGAEPGASREATLVLDFTPNAVHAGIYTALERGYLEDAGIELTVREPSSSSDAPKLLAAGRADFAILDINDFGIARARGLDLRAVAAVVQVPLAAVIARDGDQVRRPRELEGRNVGVTGLPSDDAVLDAVVAADGGDPARVERTTIGFDAVAALSAGRVDAATAFWNAEGVALRDAGLDTREFRVGESLARPYPELVVVTTGELAAAEPGLTQDLAAALELGSEAVAEDPAAGLAALVAAVPALEREVQRGQLEALLGADAFGRPASSAITGAGRDAWLGFAVRGGIIAPGARERVAAGFDVAG